MFTDEKKGLDRELLITIKKKLTKLPKAEAEEWLRTVYQVRTDRFLAENEKIWLTGSIFVPVALAPFAVWVALEDQTSLKLYMLCGISITMQIFWLLVANTHRRYQTSHETWLLAIEKIQKIDVEHHKKQHISIKFCRNILTICIFLAWFFIILLEKKVIVL